jgi:site-specific recombinase XerD
LNALVFLYRQVLKQPFPELEGLERAKRPRRVPTVFTAEETQAMLAQLHGTPRLMADLLYGAGLRLMECVRLRIKDIDIAYQQITVRDGKGAQERVTMLPQFLSSRCSTISLKFSSCMKKICERVTATCICRMPLSARTLMRTKLLRVAFWGEIVLSRRFCLVEQLLSPGNCQLP